MTTIGIIYIRLYDQLFVNVNVIRHISL